MLVDCAHFGASNPREDDTGRNYITAGNEGKIMASPQLFQGTLGRRYSKLNKKARPQPRLPLDRSQAPEQR